MDRPEWIEVGRLARPHGVHGEVRLLSTSDNPERFAPGAMVHARPARTGLARPAAVAGWVEAEAGRRPLTVESVRGDDEMPIVAFEEVTTREDAARLNGYILEVRASELPELEEDEYYPFDLIGLEVRTEDGGVVGIVTDILESPAHDLLAVSLAAAPLEVPVGSAMSAPATAPGAAASTEAAASAAEPGEAPDRAERYQAPASGAAPRQARELLIPFVEEAVPIVDAAAGFLTVTAGFLTSPEESGGSSRRERPTRATGAHGGAQAGRGGSSAGTTDVEGT